MASDGRIRIGELSKRLGISPQLLRAWERRYGLLQPDRTHGGLRLYSHRDEQRIKRMLAHLERGLPASEAARLAVRVERGASDPDANGTSQHIQALEQAVAALDEPKLQGALDRLFESVALAPALAEVIMPFLRKIGERWAQGEITIAEEHFASNLIGGRLRELARGWGGGVGPRALLACQPGERHELGLLCFGLALRERGWRIAYLGADTPVRDVGEATDRLAPAIVVLCAVSRERFAKAGSELLALGKRARVAIGGAGATEPLARRLGVQLLDGDAVGEAAALMP
jgi:DNA-binding transcriptional MerR regulator